MGSWRQLFIGLCAGCLLSGMTYAGHHAGSIPFSLGSGYYYFASKRHIDNTSVPFVALGYGLSDRFGIEALFGSFNTDSKRLEDNGSQVNGNLFAFDVVYHFFCKNYPHLEPFLLAGVGIIGMNPNGTSAHNEGNINVGVGTQIFIHPAIAFRFEARDFYTIVGGKNDVYLDGGMSFYLDELI